LHLHPAWRFERWVGIDNDEQMGRRLDEQPRSDRVPGVPERASLSRAWVSQDWWHPKLRILVGVEWWCQWWDAIPEDS
jgi:hypothetical protein